MVKRYDIERWLDDFAKAKKMLDEDKIDKHFLKCRMNDGIYLTTLVEFLMTLEEPDGVLEKARERQLGKESHLYGKSADSVIMDESQSGKE